MSDVTIRTAAPEDMKVVAQMMNALNREEGIAHRRFTEEILLRDGFGEAAVFSCLIAVGAGEALGYLLHFPCYDTVNAGRGRFMMDLYVRPQARGRGLGRALIAALAKQAAEEDATVIYWGVYKDNARAVRFYEGLGGEDTGARVFEFNYDVLRDLAKKA